MLEAIIMSFALIAGQLWAAPAMMQVRSRIEGRVTSTENRPIADARVFLQKDVYSPIKNEGRNSFPARRPKLSVRRW